MLCLFRMHLKVLSSYSMLVLTIQLELTPTRTNGRE